jgi:sugar/nucleoside kinase (ribokinase family)
MAEIYTMGELLVEIMRPEVDENLYCKGIFKGPYPSGAPVIFIDTIARMGHAGKIVGAVGKDDFGRCIVDRLKKDGVDCSDIQQDDYLSTAVAFNTYFKNGNRQFIFHIGNTAAGMAKQPESEEVSEAKFFHLMGSALCHNEVFTKNVTRYMQLFIDHKIKLSFDPNL